MEWRSFIAKPFFACAEGLEVSGGFRDYGVKKLEDNPSCIWTANGDIKEYFWHLLDMYDNK